ncbi:hypothetical protein BH20ACT16_BH20ACT16_08940 [soil metagenome]
MSARGLRPATGGTGKFAGAIDWIEWGAPFELLPTSGPYTRSSTTSIAGRDLVTSCTLSNFTFGIISPGAYRPGDWSGDALDDLYNIGGTDLSNELVNAISGEVDLVTLDFACSATLGGEPFALDGVIFADAEQFNGTEYAEGIIPSSATWRVIERVRTPGCTSAALATRTDGPATSTLRLAGDGSVCPSGPAVIAYADGATSGTLALTGTGKSAVGLGLFVTFDRGDAPASYGDAAHAVRYPHSGGVVPAGGPTDLFEPFALAEPAPPPTRLGSSVDPGGWAPSIGADGDDGAPSTGAFGPGDDETEAPPASINVTPGATYSRTAIACTGPGTVAGWIDFDASGTFDAAERSQSAPCSGSSVDLAWTVPASVKAKSTSYMRLRIAAAAGDVSGPAGVALTGEVEDHALAIAVTPATTTPPADSTPAADLAVTTTVDRRSVVANAPITWRATVTNRGTADATGVELRAVTSRAVAFTRVRTTAGTCTRKAPVRCALGSIRSGATATVTLTGRARFAGPVRNTLRVSAVQPDPAPANNVASRTTSVRGTLRLRKTADRSAVSAGGRVRYRLTVRNPTLVGVQSVRVCDRLPRGLVYVSSNRRVTRRGTSICWNLGTVPRTSSRTVLVTTRARRGVSGRRTNTATASGRGTPARVARRTVRVLG